jgi:hypothetical protein
LVEITIDYHIFSDGTAIVQSFSNFITTLVPRNCLPFNGILISVIHLLTPATMSFVNTVLIPYSLQSISVTRICSLIRSKSLVFEFESDLRSFGRSTFVHSEFISLFFLPSLHFIGRIAFHDCPSLTGIHFGLGSSIRQFSEKVFSGLRQLFAVIIPANPRDAPRPSYFQNCVSSLQLLFPAVCSISTLMRSSAVLVSVSSNSNCLLNVGVFALRHFGLVGY